MKIPRCKGASDLMPQDMRRFRRIEEVFQACCAAWGYKEIRTPVLEYLHLFTSAGTLSPSMLSRVYSFLDWDGWSGERVVLRPDGTIPSARFFVENLSEMPVARLCYVENMFSFEGTGQESRERWQCGVELMGGTEPDGDAELIMLALEILGKLGIASIDIKLSHVGLFKALLGELGMEKEEQDQMLGEILAGDAGVLGKIKGQPAEVKRFMKLLLDLQGKSLGFLGNLRSVLPSQLAAIEPHLDDLAQIAELFDSTGQSYQIDFASGEGFEYYTGMVFQFYSAGKLVGRGGRYDELIPLVGGNEVPASGFALLIGKLIPLLRQSPESRERILVTGDIRQVEGMKLSLKIASRLRGMGYVVETDLSGRDESGFRWVVSLNNQREGIFTLVNKSNGKEHAGLSADQLLDRIGRGK